MAETLTPRSPTGDMTPITIGTVTLSEEVPETITALVAHDPTSADIPQPGQTRTEGPTTILWSARGQAFAIGPAPTAAPGIAQVDQTDAWCVLALEGDQAADVLARLTPLDLNPAMFKPGHTARSLLGHMNALFHRTSATRFEIFIFRSMAHSAVHEVTKAMKALAARAAM